ncbi:MAG: hypothetical protein JO332_11175 [Planctomycetaceae bacterium]|nr:hypothetical protein [Planctomycetaceae bacterium]
MSAVLPLALVIDHDYGFLGQATSILENAGYQVRAVLSPQGLRDFARILRPELILVGLPFWEDGWGRLLRSYAPDSLVFPTASRSDAPGVAGLDRLPGLLGAERSSSALEGSRDAA